MSKWIAAQVTIAMKQPDGTASEIQGVKIQGVRQIVDTYRACMFDQGGNTLKKGNQNGFYDLQGKPRTNLIKAVTEINQAVYQHATKPGTPAEVKALNDQLFQTWDKHLVKRPGAR